MPVSPNFVDDDGVLPAVLLGEDAVKKRRLAGAEKAGQHRDWNLCGHGSVLAFQEVSACASVVALWRIMSR